MAASLSMSGSACRQTSRPYSWPMGHGVASHIILISSLLACLINCCLAHEQTLQGGLLPRLPSDSRQFHRRAEAANSTKELVCIEVAPPVLAPATDQPPCFTTLMQYSFQNSYGKPFAGQYEPPKCNFNRVVLNLTVTSAGRQFDRLAMMYLGDIEVWRTSTAEPTTNGIIWTYSKDMSHYLTLWKEPQKVIFDLGNIVNDQYTGPFNTTLTAMFFNAPQTNPPADKIFPLSARRSAANASSSFQVPTVQAINSFLIPQNVRRAVFSLSTCGQAEEEFWWSNVPETVTKTFTNNTLLGHSPFREVQLLIDNKLAGVAWPFPVIFTGGVVPGFWRPVVGINAFDLREDEIDVTPWLPVLTDGKNHTYEIKVVGLSDDGQGNAAISTIGGNWPVTGKMFVWLDNQDSTTTGSAPVIVAPPPQFFVTSETTRMPNGTNVTLNYQVLAQRQLTISNIISTSNGTQKVSWTQSLSYSNLGNMLANGNNQTNNVITSFTDASSSGYSRKAAYPLFAFSAVGGNPAAQTMTLDANIDRARNVQIAGNSVFSSDLDAYASQGPFAGSITTNRQNGTAFYFSDGVKRTSGGSGSTSQNYVLRGFQNLQPSSQQMPMGMEGTQLYARNILATNNAIVADSGPLPAGGASKIYSTEGILSSDDVSEFAFVSPANVKGGKVIWQPDG